MTSIQQLLGQGKGQIDSDSPQLDAEILLAHCLGKSRTHLYTWPDQEVSAELATRYQRLLRERAKGVPIAHIVGEREFWTLNLAVTPDTLIPRPETELLVELALELLPASCQRVVDLGTGTGAIALALAAERKQWQLLAVDRSLLAAQVAEQNRRQHRLENVLVCQGDWGQALAASSWQMVISNPPYIEITDPHLLQGDVRFEPRRALVAGQSGLADLTIIARQSRELLLPGGWLLLEHGFEQKMAVQGLLHEAGYTDIQSREDLGGRDRVTFARIA
jgi:release factor glutamine methyltransferase